MRTFAPFVAGVGAMSYGRFLTYNVVGAVLWVGLFVLAGYFFGNIPVVRENFTHRDPGDHRASRCMPIAVEAVRRGGAGRHDPAVPRGRAWCRAWASAGSWRGTRGRSASPGTRATWPTGGSRWWPPGAMGRRSRGSRQLLRAGPAHARVDSVEVQDQADDPQIPTRSFDIR